MMKCPHCRSSDVRRSHRRGLEKLLSFFQIFPYRCEVCQRRVFIYRADEHAHGHGHARS